MAKVAVALRSAPSSPPSPGDFIVDEPVNARALQAVQVAFRSRIEVSRSLSASEPGYSSVSTKQSCADGRPSRFQLNTQSERSSPTRFKVYPQSESCGSSPASGLPELEYEMFPTDPMDNRTFILLVLYTIKFRNWTDQWRATDPCVLEQLQRHLHKNNCNLTIDDIKEHVTALENDVKLHLQHDHYISEHWHTYNGVFDYVTPDYILETPPPTQFVGTDTVDNEPKPRKKMKMTCNSESCNSGKSDSSIGERFSNLMEHKEISEELFQGALCMKNISDKAKRCGFKGEELFSILHLLRLNWEHRQVFMNLDDSDAKGYALSAYYRVVPRPPPPTQ